jgi:hypothetical protein
MPAPIIGSASSLVVDWLFTPLQAGALLADLEEALRTARFVLRPAAPAVDPGPAPAPGAGRELPR